MKQWEKELRNKLDKELDDGEQEVRIDQATYYVSRNTCINYNIAVVKEERKMWKNTLFGNKAI